MPILQRILGPVLSQKIQQYFLSAAFYSFLLQIALTALTFATSLAVAWTTHDKGFGIYSSVFTWIMLLSLFAIYGTDDLSLRQIPLSSPPQIRQLLRFSAQRILLASLIAITLLLFCIEILQIPSLYQYRTHYYLAAASIPAFAFLHQLQASLRALQHMGLGQIAEKLIQPLAFILILLSAFFLLPPISDLTAISARTLSLLLAAALAAIFLRTKLPASLAPTTPIPADWDKSCRYFMLTTLLYGVSSRVDVAILDLYQIPPDQIAHYNAAARFADILAMPFMLSATIGAPLFAKLYKAQEPAQLQAFFRQITLLSFVLTAIGFTILLFFGDFFLSWFGANFAAAYPILLILALAKLAHALVGPVAYLLMMSNHERQALWVMLASVLVTLGAHILLIPYFQALGAAYATLIGLLIFELMQLYLLRKYLKIKGLLSF